MTATLLALNVLIFVAMVLTGSRPLGPADDFQLLRWGADWGPLSLGSQPWRILTSNYVHLEIWHIFFNMWCLVAFGPGVGKNLRQVDYISRLYRRAALAGSLASLWLHPMVVGAGASGAIFGLAGALITALYVGKLPYPETRSAA